MKFDSIQVLRAVAALMVVVFHSHWAASWAERGLIQIPLISDFGYLGVQLFFCISGFIICCVVNQSDFSPKKFLLRRAWRIIPLYWIVLLLILVLGATTRIFDKELGSLGVSGVVMSFLILPMQEYPLLSPGWSLEHEVIFYALAALLVPIIGVPGLFLSLLLLWTIGLYWVGWDYHLFSFTQIYFAAGIAAYWLRQYRPVVLGFGSFTFLTIAYFGVYGDIHLTSRTNDAMFAIGFSFLVSCFVSMESRGVRFTGKLVRIGDASYSLYIVHAIVFIFFSMAGYRMGLPPEIWRWVAVVVAIWVADLSYRKIELVFQRSSRRLLVTRPIAL